MSPQIDPKNRSEHTISEQSSIPSGSNNADSGVLLPTPNEIVAMLSERVIGQHDAKQALAVAVYQHFVNCAQSDIHGQRVECDNHVLLVGPSGSGKSLLLRTLGDVLKIPIYFASCATISPEGYKGKTFSNHLDTIANEICDEGNTRPAIVIWDEIDKLSLHGDNKSDAAVYQRMTQTQFLTYLDGSKCGSERELDSSKILNIGMGAFVGIDEIRDPRCKSVIGFQNSMSTVPGDIPELKPEHFIQFGLIREFVGRFTRFAALDSLDRCAMRRILTEADGNVLTRRKEFFALHKIRLEFTDDAIDEIVTRSLAHGTGARALRQIIDQALRAIEHRLPDMAHSGVHALVVDRSAVQGLTPPIEHKGAKKDLSSLLEIRRHAAYATEEEVKDEDGDDLCIF